MLRIFGRHISIAGKTKYQNIQFPCGKLYSVKSNESTLFRRNYSKNVHSSIAFQQHKNSGHVSALSTEKIAEGPQQTESELKEFKVAVEDVIRNLATRENYQDSLEAGDWLENIIRYHVPGGKVKRGLAFMRTYKMLASQQDLTPENIRLSIVMAVCIEMLEASFFILDDLMDGSILRRTRPCWYHVNNIGVAAANDVVLVQCAVYQVLEKYFSDKPYYLDTVKLFRDITFKNSLSLVLDDNVAKKGAGRVPDLNTYTMERYRTIAKYKTSFYASCFPFTLATCMTGLKNEELIRKCNDILLEIGELGQIHDDYIDCYGDPGIYGKIGTDIETRKCTWFIVTAMQRATPEQKAILADCYGFQDPVKVEKVKEVYEELDLRSAYATCLQDRYKVLYSLIDQLSNDIPPELFENYFM
ncbi:farnesyl pyrophosphate synthase-like [Periplaneta americana]|uniref:farnesyl pyrophosphate synthase-like n=1 Tax=Periplaneta americana TaxID=6978 RepID=UPI0037E864DF